MNENKHTKGPWFVDGGLESVFTEVEGEGGLTTICDLPEWLGEYQQEREANAHLIAAAPELLSSLEAAMEYIYRTPCDPDINKEQIEAGELLDSFNVEDLINKAKGYPERSEEATKGSINKAKGINK